LDNRTRASKSFNAAHVSSDGTSGNRLVSWAACNSPRNRSYSAFRLQSVQVLQRKHLHVREAG
jgi:hypothetical protein